MMNISNSTFTPKMVIKGVYSSPAKLGASSLGPSLRIAEKFSPPISASVRPNKEEEMIMQKKNVAENFASTLLLRFTELQNQEKAENSKTPEESQALVDSITAAINEIKNQFGQEAANQAMAAILNNTEDKLSADRLVSAISGVLQGIAGLNDATLKDQSVTADKYEAAKETEQKLKDFVEYLNQGTVGGGDKKTSGLSSALNSYFGQPGLPEEDQKHFTNDFAWMTSAEIAAKASQKNFSNTELPLSVAEFGRENVDKLANFLRNDLGHKEAADYITNLTDDDDIFLAIDHVRGMLYDNSEIVMPDDDPSTGILGLASLGGEGVEQAHKLTRFLNENMLDAVNSAFRSSPKLQARLQNYAARYFDGKIEDVPAGIGLTAWPGGQINAYTPYGPKPGNGNIGSIYLDDIGESSAADRQKQFMKDAAGFWRDAAQNSDPKNTEQYLQYAENSDRAYREYLAAKKPYPTESGQLVSQSV